MGTEASTPPKRRRVARQLTIGTLLVLLFVSLGWYLTSNHFREFIRHRLIAQLEDATGGQVEIARVQWNLSHLRVGIDGLTIHGLEGPGQDPLLQVNHVDASLRFASLLGRQLRLKSLTIDHPVVHLIVYPDGRTNQPSPRLRGTGGRQVPLDSIFDVAIRDLTVRNGVLQVNQQQTPFDFQANDLAAHIGYQPAPEAYAGRLQIGKFDTHWKDDRPFASSADVDFRLYRNAVEFRSAQIHSERSDLQVSGTLNNFSEPDVQAKYSLKLDLHQAGSIVRVGPLQQGIVELDGTSRFTRGQLTANGKLKLTNGAWLHPAIHAAAISGTAAYSLDGDRLQVSRINASAAGGTVTGEFTVLHWDAPPRQHSAPALKLAKGVHVMEAREQSANGTFVMRGLDVAKVTALFNSQKLPLTELHAGGSVDGTAQLTWLGSPNDAELHLDVNAAPNTSAAQLPVSAHFAGNYSFRTSNMHIAEAEAHTPATHLTAAGDFGANQLDLEIGASTANLREVQPFVEAVGFRNLPVQLTGEGSFQGTIIGRTSLPTTSGHLKISDFTTVIQPASTASQPELVKVLHKKEKTAARTAVVPPAGTPIRFHWDSFDGFVSYGPDAASIRGAVLRTGSARFEFGANASLQSGNFTDASQFHANGRIRDGRIEDVQTLLDFHYPITGLLNLELEIGGTRLEPKGTGKLTIADGTAWGEPIQSLSTDLTFSGREARFNNFHAISEGARADGSGAVNVSSEQFSFNLQGSGIDLLRVPLLQTSKVKLTGIASFNAKGSGTLSAPSVEAHARVSNISLGGKREGDLDIDAVTHGEQMDLTAASKFVTASLTAKGRIRLRGDFNSDITAEFANVDLQPFLVGVARGHSSIKGSVHVSGPLRTPRQLEARLEIPDYESEVEGVSLRNAGPIVATYGNGTVNLQSLRLTGDATDLSSSGTAQLFDAQQLKMRAEGRLNLKLIQSFNPEIVAYGQTSIGVLVGGTLRDPSLRGRITIEHAGISYVDLPNGVSDLNGSLVFNEDRLQVERLTAHTGGGDLAIGGFIAYGRNVSFNLTATGKDVRIRYPEGVSSNGDADLRLAGTLQNATLSGEVTINKFGLNPRFDFANYLTRAKQTAATPDPTSPLNSLHFDVRVVSTPELQVQTSLAKLTGNVDLRLRGTAMRPSVLGRISIVEGDITFNGTKYRLDRGDVLFTNPTKIEPVLDLEASARVSDYDISIGLHGTTDKLNTTYRSDPPLPTADVFALLAFGRTSDQAYTAPQSNAFTETASSAVLGSALNAAVSSRVQKLFGASRIKIDPEVGGAENNPNARITVEQQVSGDITLTYITNLTQSAQQVIQFQYNVNRNVSIVGVRDEYGVVGFEVQIRQRKR